MLAKIYTKIVAKIAANILMTLCTVSAVKMH